MEEDEKKMSQTEKSAEKHKALKTYTRQLLREHEELAKVADERAAEVERLQKEAAEYEAKALRLEEAQRRYEQEEEERLNGIGEEIAEPSAPAPYLFGELCRTRERASAAEVEAARLQLQLAMAKELRTVDVARTRAAASRALAAALASLRRRALNAALGDGDKMNTLLADEDDAERVLRQRAEAALAKQEREALVLRVEDAATELQEQYAQKPRALNNTDGSARRYIEAIEACLHHRSDLWSYSGFLLRVARATLSYTSSTVKKSAQRRKRADAVLVAIAQIKQANIPRWMARAGWGVGRAILLELLNRGVFALGLRALCIEDNEKTHVSKSAEAVVLSYKNGAVLLDAFAVHRILQALDAVESKAIFACHHLYERARGLDDFDRRIAKSSRSRAEAVANFVACGPDDDQDDARLFSFDHDECQRTKSEEKEEEDNDDDDDDENDLNARGKYTSTVPGLSTLAALRRRGAKSAATTALDLAPWRRATIEPPRLWSREPRGFLERRIRLKEGPVDHVVCYQWQSRSEKLRWSLVFYDTRRRRTATATDAMTPPRTGHHTQPISTSPQQSSITSQNHDSDDSLGVVEPHPSELGLALPDDESDDDASAVPTNTATGVAAQGPLVFRAPEIWSPAELIPGAERALGPVRESWCLVPAGARIALRCDLIAGRPLVRPRHARFRCVAVRADDFFHRYLRDSARAFDAAAWLVAHDRGGLPPNDAADYCAKRQLQAWASAAGSSKTLAKAKDQEAPSLFEPIAGRLSVVDGPIFLF